MDTWSFLMFAVLCVTLCHGAQLFPAMIQEMMNPAENGENYRSIVGDLKTSSKNIASQYPSVNLRTLPDFLTSACIDSSSDPDYLDEQLAGLNLNTARVYVTWRYVEATLDEPEPESFTVENLRANTDWLEPYSETLSWSLTDTTVERCLNAGVTPFIQIGEGTDHCLARVNTATFNSTTGCADVGTVGMSQYKAYMYRYGRAVVHRYKDKVNLWSIENELNDSYLQAISGLRSPNTPGALRNPWGDFTFVTEVLQTLYQAVKDEDPTLWTTQNVVCDTPENAYDLGPGFPAYYVDAVSAWDPLMDMVQFDVYPNYCVASPLYGYMLKNVTDLIRGALEDPTKPIMVAETGSHVMNESIDPVVTGSAVNYTGTAQADLLIDSLDWALQADCKGFSVFKMAPDAGLTTPAGGFTNQDINFLNVVTESVVGNSIDPVLSWIKNPLNLAYIVGGKAAEISSILTVDSFSILYADDSPRPAYTALQSAYSDLVNK